MPASNGPEAGRPRVGLFVTCLVDLFRPAIGLAAARLIESAGCDVEVPKVQNCCGRPDAMAGDPDETRELAKGIIRVFERYDDVVAPSVSCAATLRDYAGLFANDAVWRERASAFSAKVSELVTFLTEKAPAPPARAFYDGSVLYHDAGPIAGGASGRGARRLMAMMDGLAFTEVDAAGACSNCSARTTHARSQAADQRMVQAVLATRATILAANDLGCLLAIASPLSRQVPPVDVRHIAEILAGDGKHTGDAS